MDAPDIDTWIEAQQPPVYEEMRQMDGDGKAAPSVLRAQDNAKSGEGEGDKGKEGSGEKETVTGQLQGGSMRFDAIHEAAVSYAAQTALAWRYEQLREMTRRHEDTLDVIASFSPFVEDDHMLLPSITRVEDRFDISKDRTELRSSSVQYQVSEEPRAITQPPTWRDYIWRELPYPDEPHPALMPQNAEEREVWTDGINMGWESGLRQAQQDWENNLNELVRAIRGRVTYRILESRGVVQPPQMQAGEPRLTESKDGDTVNAGEVVHSITVPLDFRDESQWGALWLREDGAAPDFEQDEPALEAPTSDRPKFKEPNNE